MVKFIFTILIVLFVFPIISCDFLSITPFPEDMIYYDRSVSLKGSMSVTASDYMLSTVGDYTILKGFYSNNGSDLCWVRIFDKNLNIVYAPNNTHLRNFEFKDYDGKYFIGDQQFSGSNFTLDGSQYTIQLDAVANLNYCYGFYYYDSGAYHHVIAWVENDSTIKYFTFDDAWGTKQGPFSSTALPAGYRFTSIQFDPDNSLVIVFYEDKNNNASAFAVILPTDAFKSSPIPIPGTYTVFPINSENDNRFGCYTKKGFITADYDGDYRLYSNTTPSQIISERRLSLLHNSDYEEAIDIGCADRYVYNIGSMNLFHSRMWW